MGARRVTPVRSWTEAVYAALTADHRNPDGWFWSMIAVRQNRDIIGYACKPSTHTSDWNSQVRDNVQAFTWLSTDPPPTALDGCTLVVYVADMTGPLYELHDTRSTSFRPRTAIDFVTKLAIERDFTSRPRHVEEYRKRTPRARTYAVLSEAYIASPKD